MAIAVIGGVLVSTLLTLFVVPAAYYSLVPFEQKKTAIETIRKIKWGKLGGKLFGLILVRILTIKDQILSGDRKR